MLSSLFLIAAASEIIATPLNEASRAEEPEVIAQLERVLQAKAGCTFRARERVSLVFVLRFAKSGAVSHIEPSYVPEAARACLEERARKLQLSAVASERGYAVNATLDP